MNTVARKQQTGWWQYARSYVKQLASAPRQQCNLGAGQRRCIFQGRIVRKTLYFRAAFYQTGIVRVFAKKDFVHMRSCRDELLVFRALLSEHLFHDLISWIVVRFVRLLSPTSGQQSAVYFRSKAAG